MKIVTLQYFNGEEWIYAAEHCNKRNALVSLGDDNCNYRAVDKKSGKVLWEILSNGEHVIYNKKGE